MLFPGFESRRVQGDGAEINLVCGGKRDGRALLLLHGHPETHAIWNLMAPKLAEQYFVVAVDLRGYGDSEKIHGLPDNSNYSKRTMALDQVKVMKALGHERFLVIGHDRGARVAHRLCLDHPQAVEKAILLDICPTLAMYEQTTMEFARQYWHWFFLIQPHPFPETVLGADPEVFIRKHMSRGPKGAGLFHPEAFAEYIRCAKIPGTIHAFCSDYRAAATIDLEHDRADRAAGRKVEVPLRVYWGRDGTIAKCFDAMKIWHEYAKDVQGEAAPSGHYVPEEAPEWLLEQAAKFF
ncbi:MAG TPA: alpha/beta hydrolase [Burkholderiales bacterium]